MAFNPIDPAFKPHMGNFMDNIGLNRYMAVSGAVDATTQAGEGTLGFVQDLWDENPNTFQNASGRAVGIGVGALTTSLNVLWAAKHKAVMGKNVYSDVYRSKKGDIFGLMPGKDKAQILRGMGPSAGMTDITGKAATGFMKGAEKGFYRSKGFLGTNMGKGFTKTGFWRGPGSFLASIAIPMILGKAATPVMGLAGKMLDESFGEYHRAKRPYYDTRYFNTQNWQQSAYQQMGGAMNNYEQNQMSVARIYHSR